MVMQHTARLIPPRSYSPSEATQLRAQWEARKRTGQFSPGIVGVATIKELAASGHNEQEYPQIKDLSALAGLAADEQYMLVQAQAEAERRQGQGQTLMAASSGATEGVQPILAFDPTKPDILVLTALAGG
jgi:hypothetical protein